MMTRILAGLLALVLAAPAFAGSGTVNYNSTGSSPYRTTTDGSSNNIGNFTLWDYSAAANGLSIDASHNAGINLQECASTICLSAVGNNASIAPSASAGSPVVSFMFAYNGTSWVQFQPNPNGPTNSANSSPVTLPTNETVHDCSGSITAGGTAQNAIGAQTTLHGFVLANIDTAHQEPFWYSTTGTAAAGSQGSYPLTSPAATTYAGMGSFITPAGFGTGHSLSVVAATTGHFWSCTWW